MILLIECIAACLIFGTGITVSIFINRTSWLHEYPLEVQKQYLDTHPDFCEKKEKSGNKGLIIAKIIVCLVFVALLSFMGYLAGARTFLTGFINTYIVWTVVNVFDVIALDLGIFMYWKKIRLPGTEDMDKEYTANKWHHVKEGFYGILIGLPVCLLAGLVIALLV